MPPSRDPRPPRRDAGSAKGGPKGGGRKPAPKSAGGKGRARSDDRKGAKPTDGSLQAPKTWGSLARKGTGRLRSDIPSKASEMWRAAVEGGAEPRRPEPQQKWVRVDDVRGEATQAVARGGQQQRARSVPPLEQDRPQRQRKTTPAIAEELNKVAGSMQAPKLGQRLAEATRAFERERYAEARSMLKTLSERAPGSASVRELYGLTLYRMGQWKLATRELEAFAALSGSTEQHPVLADCARAMRRWTRVDELWDELRVASPSAELVAEGRIVAAGALADRGKLAEAIELLEHGLKTPKRLKEHHLRVLYALADLRERAGEVPAARAIFRRVYEADPGFADVADRIRAL